MANQDAVYKNRSTGLVTISGSLKVTGSLIIDSGLTGSLTQLSDGSPYLIAGSNVTLSTGSSGAVTIASTGGAGGTSYFTSPSNGELIQTGSLSLSGSLLVKSGLTGALNELPDGSPYLIAGTNITLSTGSSGAVTITSTGGGGGTSYFTSPSNEQLVQSGSLSLSGSLLVKSGLTGALNELPDGSPYLLAGTNITLSTGSSGAVTINSTGGGSGSDTDWTEVTSSTGIWNTTTASISIGADLYLTSSAKVYISNDYFYEGFEGIASGALPAGWTTDGDASWGVVDYEAYTGTRSAQAGDIGDNQSTHLRLPVTVSSDSSVVFSWKCSSENTHDKISFYIDDVLTGTPISNITNWEAVTASLSSGSHDLRWTYSKDPSVSSGQDTGWIDDVHIFDSTVTSLHIPRGHVSFGAFSSNIPFIVGPDHNSLFQADTKFASTVSGAFIKNYSGKPIYLGAQGISSTINPLKFGVEDTQVLIEGVNGWKTNSPRTSFDNAPVLNHRPVFLGSILPVNSGTLNSPTLHVKGRNASSMETFENQNSGTLPSYLNSYGNKPWAVVTLPAAFAYAAGAYGNTALQSGDIDDNQLSIFAITRSFDVPTRIQFAYRTNAESVDDLNFYINDSLELSQGGITTWNTFTSSIFSGSQRFKWEYKKDATVSTGQDAVWVDRIEFIDVEASASLRPAIVVETGSVGIGVSNPQNGVVLEVSGGLTIFKENVHISGNLSVDGTSPSAGGASYFVSPSSGQLIQSGSLSLSGSLLVKSGLTGALNELPDGSPFIKSTDSNLSISTGSNGQILLTAATVVTASAQKNSIVDYATTTATSSSPEIVGQVIFNPEEYFGEVILRAVLSNTDSLTTSSIKLLNVASGAYVELNVGSEQIDHIGTTSTIVTSSDLRSAINFSTVEALYELQLFTSNVSNTAIVGAAELKTEGIINSSSVGEALQINITDYATTTATSSSPETVGQVSFNPFLYSSPVVLNAILTAGSASVSSSIKLFNLDDGQYVDVGGTGLTTLTNTTTTPTKISSVDLRYAAGFNANSGSNYELQLFTGNASHIATVGGAHFEVSGNFTSILSNPTGSYSTTFTVADWQLTGSSEVYTVSGTVHNLSVNDFTVQTFELIGSDYALTTPQQTLVKSNSDVQLTVASGSGFDGKIIIHSKNLPGASFGTAVGGSITPNRQDTAQITTEQDDYTGGGVLDDSLTAMVISASGSQKITGFDSSGISDGKEFTVINATSGTLTLRHQSTGSASGNRINIPGGLDLDLDQHDAVRLMLDATLNAWRII